MKPLDPSVVEKTKEIILIKMHLAWYPVGPQQRSLHFLYVFCFILPPPAGEDTDSQTPPLKQKDPLPKDYLLSAFLGTQIGKKKKKKRLAFTDTRNDSSSKKNIESKIGSPNWGPSPSEVSVTRAPRVSFFGLPSVWIWGAWLSPLPSHFLHTFPTTPSFP